VTDELLMNELTVTINVGMGATDPQLKLQKFLVALNTFTQMLAKPVPGINLQEIGKEIFGYLGYDDPTRFFTSDNPQVQILQQQMQQLMQMNNQLQMKLKEKMSGHMINLTKGREANQTKIMTEKMKQTGEDRRNTITHMHALRELNNNTSLEIFKHLMPKGSDKEKGNKNGRGSTKPNE